jgi:hypothetical protein
MKNIFWTAYSHEERHLAINTIQDIVSQHGDIIDFKAFSDISLTITIEIKESEVDLLYGKLKDKTIMNQFEYLDSGSPRERILYLNITFIKGTGDHRSEILSTPG